MKRTMKKIAVVILALIMFSTVFPLTAMGSEISDFQMAQNAVGKYYGTYGEKPYDIFDYMTLTVEKVKGSKFFGHFSGTGKYPWAEDIKGNINIYTDGNGTRYVQLYYDIGVEYPLFIGGIILKGLTMIFTIYPNSSAVNVFSSGGAHSERFNINKVVDSHPVNELSEKKLSLAMELSNAAYGDTEIGGIPNELSTTLEKNKYSDIERYNFADHNKDNVSFTISHRDISDFNNNRQKELCVVIRGTDGEEWYGNMEITGTSYNAAEKVHKSFRMAKESLAAAVADYCSAHSEVLGGGNLRLFVTGHSRGAAVANLYAKDMTDRIGEQGALFNDVSAYTFATPNVDKYSQSMESSAYSNIFNFCFYEDFVPSIPLSSPSGWNYWKYGQTYTLKLTSLPGTNPLFANENVVSDVQANMKRWNNVEKYYLKNNFDNSGANPNSLYEVFRDGVAQTMMFKLSSIGGGIRKLLSSYVDYKNFRPLIGEVALNAIQIGSSHRPEKYNEVIGDSGSAGFEKISFDEMNAAIKAGMSSNSFNAVSMAAYNNDSENAPMNAAEKAKLITFAQSGENLAALGWDMSDESTFSGITLDSDGFVTAVDLQYLDLTGTLDLAGLEHLGYVNIAGNNIAALNLDGCLNLSYLNAAENMLTALDIEDCVKLSALDCSYNEVEALNLSTNVLLSELSCESCGLASLDLSSLQQLTKLKCSFNNTTVLDISANANLLYLDCSYNVLNIEENSEQFNALLAIGEKADSYLNYDPQKIEENAVFNSAEILKLTSFANQGDNLDTLEWDLNEPEEWYNVEWAKAGNEYHAVNIDFSQTGVSGNLDLSAFSRLLGVGCINTGIETINLSSCPKLELVDCTDSKITQLNIDNCPAITTLKCSKNYIDLSLMKSKIDLIRAKTDSEVEDKPQYVSAPVSSFNEGEYNTLKALAQAQGEETSLGWDVNKPGEWAGVTWTEVDGVFYVSALDLSFSKATGSIDLSDFTHLSEIDFSNSSLSTIILPNNLTKVSDYAFYGCDNLASIVLPNKVSEIGSYAFYDCNSLETVNIPLTLTNIGDYSFANCPSLEYLSDVRSVISIGEFAFSGSDLLTMCGGENGYAKNYATNYEIDYVVKLYNTVSGYVGAMVPIESSGEKRPLTGALIELYKDDVPFQLETLGSPTKIEAEAVTLTNGEIQNRPGYSGGKGVNHGKDITVKYTADCAGDYQLGVAATFPRNFTVTVNGENAVSYKHINPGVNTLNEPSQVMNITLKLNKGENSVRFTSPPSEYAPIYDYFVFRRVQPPNVLTDEKGYFQMDGLPDGNYQVKIKGDALLERNIPFTVAGGNVALSAPSAYIELVICDFNGDGFVNASDTSELQGYFGASMAENPELVRYDLNLDGVIDSSDQTYMNAFLGYGQYPEWVVPNSGGA